MISKLPKNVENVISLLWVASGHWTSTCSMLARLDNLLKIMLWPTGG